MQPIRRGERVRGEEEEISGVRLQNDDLCLGFNLKGTSHNQVMGQILFGVECKV